VARILIVGGGCRGRRLARRLAQDDGHAVRITTRTEAGRAAIEEVGAECWIGTPDRLATLRGSLDRVAIACWMLAGARGEPEEVAALHSSRLEFFLSQAIDTTVRGIVYDASPGVVAPELLAAGEQSFRSITQLNAIPALVLGRGAGVGGQDDRAAGDDDRWVSQAEGAVRSLLGL
jgi:hypothetical protein